MEREVWTSMEGMIWTGEGFGWGNGGDLDSCWSLIWVGGMKQGGRVSVRYVGKSFYFYFFIFFFFSFMFIILEDCFNYFFHSKVCCSCAADFFFFLYWLLTFWDVSDTLQLFPVPWLEGLKTGQMVGRQ